MPTDTFEIALAHLDAGELDEVRRLARDLIVDHDARGDGLYLLGRTYQLEGKPHIALYLLEQAAARVSPPDTEEYLAESRAAVEASGWTEDFTDRGHTVCPTCRLYYRAEYSECPYCSPVLVSDTEGSETYAGNDALGWEDDVFDKADRLGRSVLERAREIADSRSVKEMGERARLLSKEAVERARTFSDKQEVRDAVERARRAGTEATQSARKILDTQAARTIQDTTRETGASLAKHVKDFVNEERSRYESADEDRRRAIFIKWVLIGVAVLIGLRVLAWIF